MEKTQTGWLEHLEYAVPETGYGNRLSMYLIALEAWRRGIKIHFYNEDNPENKVLVRYSLEYSGKEYHFVSSQGEKLTSEAYEICKNKDETKKYLSKNGVPVPKGKRFIGAIDQAEIVTYAESIGFPVVLKPTDANAGKGVFSGILTKEDLIDSLDHVTNDLGYKDIVVEKYIPGTEYRVLLINGQIAGAVNRIPANITGDGKSTVQELIKRKNAIKKNNPNLSSKIIKVDREVLDSLKKYGYDLNSIPNDQELIYLRAKSNISTGGDPIDVTDSMTEELKEIAVKAAKSIPGLDICGLDMIVDPEKNHGTIIEINTRPMIGLHLFPMEGKARDVVKLIVDYYFPETKDIERSRLYFDFNNTIAPLNNISTKHVEVLPPPSLKKIHAKKYVVTGDISGVGYQSWLRRKARENDLHGYTEKIDQNKIEVLVAGIDQTKVDSFKTYCLQGPDSTDAFHIENVEELEWNKPVKIGFEIKKEDTVKKLRESLASERTKGKQLKEQSTKLKDNLSTKKEQIKKLIKRNNNLINRNKTLKDNNSKFRTQIKDLQSKTITMEEKIKQKQDKIKQLEQEKKEALRQRSVYKEKLIEIRNSRSYRYTEPIRKALKIFR